MRGRLWLAVLLAGSLVAGCTQSTSGGPAPSESLAVPDPASVVVALATGLSSLEVSGVPFAGAAAAEVQTQLTAAVAGMGARRPAVTVQGVQQAPDHSTATATLGVVWDVDATAQDWAYTTSVALVRAPAGTLPAGQAPGWQVSWAPSVLEPSLRTGDRLALLDLAPKRGDITGAGGAVLVTDRPVLRVGIDKTRVPPEQAEGSARALAALVQVDPDSLATRVDAAGDRAFVEAVVLRAEAPEVPPAPELAAIPGAVALPAEIPLALTRDFARPLLGTVGEATKELIDASGGRLARGDSTGLSGLQRQYDPALSGTAGVAVYARPPDAGVQSRELFRRDAVDGQPVATSLDPVLQQRAETILAGVVPASAVVAIQPSTGDVLAAASGPGSQGYSTATLGQYAPGSTFKVVSSLALLRTGATPDSRLPCTASITVNGQTFTNYSDFPAGRTGDIPLADAVAYSCNTAFIAARDTVSQQALHDAAASLGLGQPINLGLDAVTGDVPVQTGGNEHAASMIGQGRVQASPLGMAVVAASVERAAPVQPRLVLSPAPTVAPSAAAPVTAGEAQQLQGLMRGVVTRGSASILAGVPGSPVAAKTGTAEYGQEQPPRTHAWMIAIQGDLAVAVFVDDGVSGSRTAGPLLQQFLTG